MRAEVKPDEIRRELELAERARREGREGRARVCARRAAGWSVGPYYHRHAGGAATPNVVRMLRWYSDCPDVPSELRAAAGRLAVTVNEDHRLPHDEDPLEDARRLVGHLLTESES